MLTAPRKWLLLSSLALALSACAVDGEPTPAGADCAGGKCDGIGNQYGDTAMQAEPRAPGGFAITRSSDGAWFFETIGARGEIVLMSQAYAQRPSALNGILSVEENGVSLEQYRVKQDAQGNWRFELRAGNNQVIAESQLFRTEEEATAAVKEVRNLVAGILQFKAAVEQGARFDLWREPTTYEWYFSLRAEDDSVRLLSEGYVGRTGAVNGIESVRENGKLEARYELRESAGSVSFILKAANGQEIGESLPFDSVEEALDGIAATQALLSSERVANPW